MDKVDKTKEKLGITNLDDSTKKELFDKFQKAGGQVIDEKTKRRNLVIDRNSQRYIQKKLDAKKEKLKEASLKKKPPTKDSTRQKTQVEKKALLTRTSFLSSLFLRIKLRLNNIAEFNGLYFKLKFLERFNNIYKPVFMEFQMIYLNIFRKNPKIGNEIIQKLDKLDPIYYELIIMVSDLYDKMIIDQIVDNYLNFPDVPKKVSELKDQLMSIYRRLYILRPYHNMIIDAFEKSVDFLQRIDRDSKNAGYSSMKRKIKNGMSLCIYNLIPRLHILFCYYQGYNFDLFDSSIESLLVINNSDKPGNRRKSQDIIDENTEENEDEGLTEDEKESIPEHIKIGLKMMFDLNLPVLRREFDKYGLFNATDENDKVLTCYLLFREFDNEYSVILTTNKIKFNVSFTNKGTVDYRSILHGLYDEMRKCDESFNNYSEVLDNFDRAKKEKPMSNAQYIDYTKRLELFQKKRVHVGREALKTVNEYLDRLSATMASIIQDMESQQTVIENPQDVLEFESHIEGLKKLHNKKIYEAIIITYRYVSSLAYRLGPMGDLSGNIEYKHDENKQSNQVEEKYSDTNNSVSQKSVLDELDDML